MGRASNDPAEFRREAVRLTNTDADGRRGGESPPYGDWTKDELDARARGLDIEGRSHMDKGELFDALRSG